MGASVSVVMAVYNGVRFLAQAIESVLNQSFKDFEYIIIDDGSSDATSHLLEGYRQKDSRIRILRNEKNIGLVSSLNRGLDSVQSKYVARMDADDVSLPNRLQRQVAFLEENPDVFLVGSSAYILDEAGNQIGEKRVLLDPKIIQSRLRRTNCLIHPSILFRFRSDVRYREKALYCEDYDLYLRLISRNLKLANIKEPLIRYRLVRNSLSFRNAYYARLFAARMRNMILNRGDAGQEAYERFSPDEVLSQPVPMDSEQMVDLRYLGLLLDYRNSTLLNDLSKQCLARYGLFNKAFIYYILSMLLRIRERVIRFGTQQKVSGVRL